MVGEGLWVSKREKKRMRQKAVGGRTRGKGKRVAVEEEEHGSRNVRRKGGSEDGSLSKSKNAAATLILRCLKKMANCSRISEST